MHMVSELKNQKKTLKNKKTRPVANVRENKPSIKVLTINT
jgi:hypothetical protein